MLASRMGDYIDAARRDGLSFTRFFSESEFAAAYALAEKSGLLFAAFGGYDDAERKMISLCDYAMPESVWFPITALAFDCPRGEITHRDVLGAVMALGVKREFIGDIIFFDGVCCIFADTSIAEFIMRELTSVSNLTVSLREYEGKIGFKRAYEQMTLSVSSMRLDCVVSALAPCSRTLSAELIAQGYVSLNGVLCDKKDAAVQTGDTVSIRRRGKFRIGEPVGVTKKERIKLRIFKYI